MKKISTTVENHSKYDDNPAKQRQALSIFLEKKKKKEKKILFFNSCLLMHYFDKIKNIWKSILPAVTQFSVA